MRCAILEFLLCTIIWFLLLFSLIFCFWEQSKVKNIYRSPLALKYLCWLTETHIWTFVTRRNCIKFERQKRHKWCSWVFPWCSYQFDISCDLVLYRPTTKCNLFLNTIKTQSVEMVTSLRVCPPMDYKTVPIKNRVSFSLLNKLW